MIGFLWGSSLVCLTLIAGGPKGIRLDFGALVGSVYEDFYEDLGIEVMGFLSARTAFSMLV